MRADPAGLRAEGLRDGQAWGSLLSARDFAAISGVGFDPVGYVFGTAVVHLGYAPRGGQCSGSTSYTPRTDLASAMSGPFNALLRKATGVRRLALRRAVQQCEALGGDGIVGVTLSIKPFPAGGTEFTLQGTAVRARTVTRPATPFTSHVSAQEFARLLRAGWVPTAIVFGIALGARHDDIRTWRQARRSAGNLEVRNYTHLVNDTRRDARNQLAQAVAAQGGDGVVVTEMTLHISERECPTNEGNHDHVAEATILGTAVASFGRPPAGEGRAPLTIMHLNPAPAVPGGLLAAGPPAGLPEPPPAHAVPEGGPFDRLMSAWVVRRASRGPISASDPSGITRRPGLEHD
jgi:uncharacterized protein YbjQ (UPF0145 family)